jgi:hypothetical protein
MSARLQRAIRLLAEIQRLEEKAAAPDKELEIRRREQELRERREIKLVSYLRQSRNPYSAEKLKMAERAWIEEGQWILDDE